MTSRAREYACSRARQKELSHPRWGQALPPFPGPRRPSQALQGGPPGRWTQASAGPRRPWGPVGAGPAPVCQALGRGGGRAGPRKQAQPGPPAQPGLASDSEQAFSFSARAALAQNGPTDIFRVPVLELRARPLGEAWAAALKCTNLAGPETKFWFLFELALDDRSQ